jgi:(1->4)-alpha-D-glucan 1-alpha-D-glucosylmutase
MMAPALLATYRLQLTKAFGFDDAASLASYLKQLGITHLYASPFLKARPGSTHGYDIVDHDRLNPELGGEEAFARLSAALKQNGLGLILDFVPNHMGVGHADNAWWLDVLEWGQRSPYAASFDIDWGGIPYRRHPGVLVPILGRPYGEALQRGEIQLKYDADTGSFAAWYFEHKLPINPQRYGEIVRTLVAAADAAGTSAGRILLALADDYRDPRAPSYRDAPVLKKRLADIAGAADVFARGAVAYRGDSESGAAALHRLLERQHYRVAFWRVAVSAVNYRRFFDISDLAGLRVENPATFRAMHTLVARLIEGGELQGLRLDHIDGLRDPAQYTRRLRQLISKLRGRPHKGAAFIILVEKILAEDEKMPALPAVGGTTGYEWLNTISRVLVDGKGLDRLERSWRGFTGEQQTFSEILEAAKRRVIESMLASEFTVLTGALARIAAGHFSSRDFTLDRLRAALQAYVVEFPVYRTYVTAAGASATDRETIENAISRARNRWQGPDPEIFDFLRDAMTLELAANAGYSAPRVRNFALKLQQFTGPLMAKAMEDTTFYRYHRLLALNEVGGDPSARELSLSEFHRLQQQRAENAPGGLTATATHDTKRGEDARARIMSLSELAAEWEGATQHWREQNAPLVREAGGHRCPSIGHEYMIYQSLIGAWPDHIDKSFVERMQAYALKAAREAKQETSWTNPNEDYEKGLHDFVGSLLDRPASTVFLKSFGDFATRAALLGALNSLSQLALKVMLPGVPDFYQGTELWDFSLVDPDNRRAVDFAARQKLVTETADWPGLAAAWQNGHIKLILTRQLLALRHRFADLFRHGDYKPLAVSGEHAEHVIVFTRRWKKQELVVAVGRHFAALSESGRSWPTGWDGVITHESGGYECLVGGGSGHVTDLHLATIFAALPLCVLRRL